MTLKEFDQIRPYLPEDTEVTVSSIHPTEQENPKPDEKWTMEIIDWGNHDGRFNIHCCACGWYSNDIPAGEKGVYKKMYLRKPCPKCGKKFFKTKKEDD